MIVEVGEVVEGSCTASDWIHSHPRGSYTVARTVRRTRVLELTAHIHRLADSSRLMQLDATVTADALRQPVLCIVRRAIQSTAIATELKLTLLLYPCSAALRLDCHVQPLPTPPAPPIRVQLGGHPRANAAAKDSSWVDARAALVQAQLPGVHETLLVDDHYVYEGLSSNVFAVLVCRFARRWCAHDNMAGQWHRVHGRCRRLGRHRPHRCPRCLCEAGRAGGARATSQARRGHYMAGSVSHQHEPTRALH